MKRRQELVWAFGIAPNHLRVGSLLHSRARQPSGCLRYGRKALAARHWHASSDAISGHLSHSLSVRRVWEEGSKKIASSHHCTPAPVLIFLMPRNIKIVISDVPGLGVDERQLFRLCYFKARGDHLNTFFTSRKKTFKKKIDFK